mgnify:CR=1 FL=1
MVVADHSYAPRGDLESFYEQATVHLDCIQAITCNSVVTGVNYYCVSIGDGWHHAVSVDRNDVEGIWIGSVSKLPNKFGRNLDHADDFFSVDHYTSAA